MSKYIILPFLIAIQIGCFKERIELDYNQDEQKKIVIAGWINSLPEPQYISIYFTANYLGAESQEPIIGAEVLLKDENQTHQTHEDKPGHYFLPNTWKAQVGDIYQLEVNYAGKTYTATHRMRANPEIENLRYQELQIEPEDNQIHYETIFDFQETPGIGDAYYAVDYRKGALAKDSIANGGYADDRFVDGQYFEDIIVTEAERSFIKGDTVIIEMHSIGLEAALYLQDIENEIYRGSPFDPPPANVRTNLTGGAIGYFIASDARTDTIIIR